MAWNEQDKRAYLTRLHSQGDEALKQALVNESRWEQLQAEAKRRNCTIWQVLGELSPERLEKIFVTGAFHGGTSTPFAQSSPHINMPQAQPYHPATIDVPPPQGSPHGTQAHQSSARLAAIPQPPQLPSQRTLNIPGNPYEHAPAAAAQPSGLEEKIGRYSVWVELGKGGMGRAVLAHDPQLGRTVVVKTILGQADADTILRFKKEAQALARIQHENVVRVYEVGHDGRQMYIAMENIPGAADLHKSLPSIVARKDRWQKIAHVLEGTARGVAAAHEKKILHRDLKPANVLLTADGTPKVIDFGLAKDTSADGGLTVEGAVLGTPDYMPPEQILGRTKEVDERSDVYSLGVILYEMLTLSRPFAGRNYLELAEQAQDPNRVPLRPTQLEKNVPPPLETIALKALNKKKEERYQTAQELADDLKRYLAGEPILAMPEGPGRRAVRAVKRNKVPILAGLATLAAVYAGISGYRASKSENAALRLAQEKAQADLDAADRERDLLRRAQEAERSVRGERAQTYVTEMRAMIAQERFNDAARLYALALDNATDREALEQTLAEDKRQIDGIMNITIRTNGQGSWNIDRILSDRFERVFPAQDQHNSNHTLPLRRGESYVLEANGYRQAFAVTQDATIAVRQPEELREFIFIPGTKPGEQDIYFTRWPINRLSYTGDRTAGDGALPITGITARSAQEYAQRMERAIRELKSDDRWEVRLPTTAEFERALAPQSGWTYPWGAQMREGRAVSISAVRANGVEGLLIPTTIAYTDPRFAVTPTGLHLSNCSIITQDGERYFAALPDMTEQDARLYSFIQSRDSSNNHPFVLRPIPETGRSPTLGFYLVAYKRAQ
ncbi:serine/threonine protein kinase [Candidatus Woesearchaeota archaeon]|nr:MAG: serine/threonine protein kinase [Candidatus Woesearchaeota archaeon]